VKRVQLDKRAQLVKLVQLVKRVQPVKRVQLDKPVQPVQSGQQEVLVVGFLYLQLLTRP
jgi:hypothetical protein